MNFCRRTDIDSTLNALQASIERINTEVAKWETRMIITIAGLIVGGVAILGFILN